jgi:hypothetical protein
MVSDKHNVGVAQGSRNTVTAMAHRTAAHPRNGAFRPLRKLRDVAGLYQQSARKDCVITEVS